ncbi:MAG: hypothetical protein AAFR14_03880 [Bacteroidota bacterium]
MSHVEVAVTVQHDPSHAWEYYCNQTNLWWPAAMHTDPRTKRFTIDTYIGGKVYEDFGEGGGLIWAEVIGVDYTRSLQLKGHLTRQFGGPVITFERFDFCPNDDGSTTLTYRMDIVGDMAEAGIKSLQDGWTDILTKHFKAYCDLH